MLGKTIIFLTFLGLSTCTLTPLDADSLCLIVTDKTVITDPETCTQYFECKGGKSTSKTCPDGLIYDKNNKKCTDKHVDGCDDENLSPCKGKADGTFAADSNPNLCNKYYYCMNETSLSEGYCSNKNNFSPITQSCVDPSEYKCTSAQFQLCNVIPEGAFFGDTSDCNKYQWCSKGQLLSGSCPSAMNFNVEIEGGFCDYSQTCRQLTSEVPTESPPVNPPKSCTTKGKFESDGKTCSGYLYCNEENLYMDGKCANGKFFDDGLCHDRTKVQCKYDRCDGMGGPGKEYANANADGCTGFLSCSKDGKTTGSGVCKDDLYFDELKQTCVQTVINYESCSASGSATTSSPTTNNSTVSDDGTASEGSSVTDDGTVTVDSTVTTTATTTIDPDPPAGN